MSVHGVAGVLRALAGMGVGRQGNPECEAD